jgi:hypothetical protein
MPNKDFFFLRKSFTRFLKTAAPHPDSEANKKRRVGLFPHGAFYI